MVPAPAAIAASTTRHRKSRSERPASSGENSTSSVCRRARRTAAAACSSTCSSRMRSFRRMWIGEVAMKVWMRGRAAPASASAARSMSRSSARARPHTAHSVIAAPISRTAANSSGLAIGKPASITSTRSCCRARAIFSFCARVIDAPGLCSPSRSVVSKMISLSIAVLPLPGRRGAAR